MTALKATIGVGDLQGMIFEELEVVAGTGATYTLIPREVLVRLGVPVWESVPSETADGRIVPAEVGWTTIRLEGQEFPTPVIFAEEGEPSLLGMVALGHALLAVDPVRHRLVPVNARR